jgi:7-carboxy-7-deazaguanine synthase
MQLQVTEIFKSIQGESTLAGAPCTFIRLTGCNLRCGYCDTAYAYEGGEYLSINDIISKVGEYNSRMVEITGGEPLLQDAVYTLIKTLLKKNKEVLIETNGSIDIERVKGQGSRVKEQGSSLPLQAVSRWVKVIMDIKCPDSGMSDKMNWENLNKLGKNDEVKFVISSKDDYNWSKEIIKRYSLIEKCPVLLSPAYGMLDSKELSEWIIEDNMNVRLNLQIHKYIWGEGIRGV